MKFKSEHTAYMFNVIETQAAFIPEIQYKSKPALSVCILILIAEDFQNFNVSLGQLFLPSGIGLNIGIIFVVC